MAGKVERCALCGRAGKTFKRELDSGDWVFCGNSKCAFFHLDPIQQPGWGDLQRAIAAKVEGARADKCR